MTLDDFMKFISHDPVVGRGKWADEPCLVQIIWNYYSVYYTVENTNKLTIEYFVCLYRNQNK